MSPARPARRGGGALVLAVVLVAAPFVVVAARAVLVDQHLLFGGDQALIGLDTDDAERLRQTLGPYSRYGFAHPGPLWFYLLAPVYWLAGSTSAALVAAVASLNAVFAGLLVGLAHRPGAVVRPLAAASLVGVFVLRMPAGFFVDVWNPFALLLPTALLLACAAEAATRTSPAWLLGAALAGSFLVQTHLGAAPMVGLVLLASAIAVLAGWRHGRLAPPGRHRGWAPLLGVLVLVWVPPLVQQVTAAPGAGNLRRVAAFVRHSPTAHGGHSVPEAVTAVGRLLGMAPAGWGSGPLEMDVAAHPPTVLAAVAVEVVVAVGLVLAGWRLDAPRAGWTGGFVLVALVAAVAAARSTTGPIYWYLLVWVSVLPLVTALGLLDLVTVWLGPVPPRATWPGRAAAVVALGLTALTALFLVRALDAVPDSPGSHAAARLAEHLPRGVPVTVELADNQLWPVAAGLAYQLVADGEQVWGTASTAVLFGPERLAEHPVGTVLVLADPGAPGVPGRLLGTFDTELGPAALYLRPA